jgi:lipopolysaccharide biosynthesis regulator YciM
VADLLEALDHDAEQLDAQAQAQQAAQSSLDLARASYREGNVEMGSLGLNRDSAEVSKSARAQIRAHVVHIRGEYATSFQTLATER